jgi:tetratricopeptide (TPR) repeat protein
MTAENEQAPLVIKGGRWYALLALLALALFGLRTISHSDFWMTLASGRWIAIHGAPQTDPFSLLRPDAPWLDPMWLYDLMVYHLWSAGGAALVTAVHIAAVLAAFGLLMRAARPLGGVLALAVALLVAAWLLAPAFMARARVFTLVFPALFICCLARHGDRWWIWLVLFPAQVLWTNMHHTFRLGPVICLLFALQEWLRWRQARRQPEGATPVACRVWLKPLLLAGATLAATLMNPYGLNIYAAVSSVGLGSGSLLLAEQVSAFSYVFGGSDKNALIWAAAVVNLMGLIAEKHRLPLAVTLLALLGTGLAIMTPHYATIMAVFSFPFFVLSVRAVGLFLWDSFAEVVQRRQELFARLLVGGLLVVTVFTIGRLASNHYYWSHGSGSAFGLGINEEALPAAATAVLRQEQFPAALLNNALDGGNLLWHLPRRKVFLDARAPVHGAALLQLAAKGFAGDGPSWRTIEERLRPAGVLINCCHPQSILSLRNILSSGRWGLAYFDGTNALLLRNTPEQRAWLENQQVRLLGLANLELARRAYEKRLAAHWFPAHSPALIGAGHLLQALEKFDEAEKIYALLTRGAPNMVGAWLELGVCRCHLGRWQDALTPLRRALDGAPQNTVGWLWYSRACQQTGLFVEAREAQQRAQKLNPNLAAQFENEQPAPVPTNRPAARLR